MIPELEYQTFLNMLKGADERGYEKAKTDKDIAKNLKNKKINELVKSKTNDFLIKKRQRQRNAIELERQKPQRVLLDEDQLKSVASGISKYLGVAPPQTPTTSRTKRSLSELSTPKTHLEESESDGEQYSPTKSYLIHPDYGEDLKKIFSRNPVSYNLTKKGGILDDNKHPILGSNINFVVDYLTGKRKEKPPGTDEIIDRIKDKSFYKNALKWTKQQDGSGKKIYTRGLVRKKFKPLVWARVNR